jgi:hypothetical protein
MARSRAVSVLIIFFTVLYGYLVYSTVISPEPSPFTVAETRAGRGVGKKVVVAFRNDDLTVYSDPVHEDSILSLFWKHGVTQTFGFIPDPNLYVSGDADTFAVRRAMVDSLSLWNARGKIDLAIHGYTHLRSEGSDGEFDKLSLDVQLGMIRRAKAMTDSILQVNVRVFAPPFNQADSNTIKACGMSGIDIFSGYVGGKPTGGVHQVNCNAVLFTRGTPPPELRSQGLADFEDVLRFARTGNGTAFVVAFYHSRVDFEDGSRYAYLDSLLYELRGDPQVEIASLAEIAGRYGDLLPGYNLAGWNLTEAEMAESRSRPYMRIVRSLRELFGGTLLIDELYGRAMRTYWAGDYARASGLAGQIVERADGYLVVGRLVAIVAGAALLGLVFWRLRVGRAKNASKGLLWFGAAIFVLALVSVGVVHVGMNLSAQRVTEFTVLAGLCAGTIVLGCILLRRIGAPRAGENTPGASKRI